MTNKIPIRRVVSSVDSPTYELSTWLNQFLKTLYKNTFNFTVKNSLDLTDKNSKIALDESDTMISLDVINLFTNIHIAEVLNIIKNNLIANDFSSQA